ncbi:MAG: hypothetical protein ACON4R_17035 [Akkermansiaceae bacterium]
MDGVNKIMLSGMTAFVTTKSEDTKMDKKSISKAFAAKGLKLEKVSTREITKPVETYQIAVTGGT